MGLTETQRKSGWGKNTFTKRKQWIRWKKEKRRRREIKSFHKQVVRERSMRGQFSGKRSARYVRTSMKKKKEERKRRSRTTISNTTKKDQIGAEVKAKEPCLAVL